MKGGYAAEITCGKISMKTYEVLLRGHFEKRIDVKAFSEKEAKEKVEMLLFETNALNFTKDEFVKGEAKMLSCDESREDSSKKTKSDIHFLLGK